MLAWPDGEDGSFHRRGREDPAVVRSFVVAAALSPSVFDASAPSSPSTRPNRTSRFASGHSVRCGGMFVFVICGRWLQQASISRIDGYGGIHHRPSPSELLSVPPLG
uniref:Uncharacterized protein n=1 Tax=Oryza punctata TaxID=4537 RepID=A0A0E0K8F3_ORYPU